MAAFRFEALTDAGKTDSGVIEAESARHARSLVRARGLAPVVVEPISADAAGTAQSDGAPRLR